MPRILSITLVALGVLALAFNFYMGAVILDAGRRPLGQGVIVYTIRPPEIEKTYIEGGLRSMSSRFDLVDVTPAVAGEEPGEDVREIEEFHALASAAKFFPRGTVLVRFHPLAEEPLRVVRHSTGVLAVASAKDDPHEFFPHEGSGLPEDAPEVRRVAHPRLAGGEGMQALDHQMRVAARLSLGFEFEDVGPLEDTD